MIERARVREALTGPVASGPTLFLQDGEIDFAGLRRYVDFVIAGGSKALILTFGDSLFTLLGDHEVAEITRAVAQQSAGRALVVAADRSWGTPQLVQFARQIRELGADLLMPLPPDWANSCEPATLVEHYAAAAQEMPLMLITALFARRPMAQSLQIIAQVQLRRRVARHPGIARHRRPLAAQALLFVERRGYGEVGRLPEREGLVIEAHCLLVGHFVAGAAARFVDFAGPDHDDRVVEEGRLTVDETLGTAGRLAALDANGLELVHLLGYGHQQRHGAEGLAAKVHVQAGDDDAHALIGQLIAQLGDFPVEELRFVDGDDRRIRLQIIDDL